MAKRAMSRIEGNDRTIARFQSAAWKPGRVDCFHLAIVHLRHFGWKIPQFAAYRTIAQGEAQMKALGLATMADVIDRIGVPRHPAPAFAMQGDLVFLPGAAEAGLGGGLGSIGAICISLGNGTHMGFAEGHDCLVSMRSEMVTVAWNVVR